MQAFVDASYNKRVIRELFHAGALSKTRYAKAEVLLHAGAQAEQICLGLGWVSEAAYGRALEAVSGLSFVGRVARAPALSALAREWAAFGVIPLRYTRNECVVAVADPTDTQRFQAWLQDPRLKDRAITRCVTLWSAFPATSKHKHHHTHTHHASKQLAIGLSGSALWQSFLRTHEGVFIVRSARIPKEVTQLAKLSDNAWSISKHCVQASADEKAYAAALSGMPLVIHTFHAWPLQTFLEKSGLPVYEAVHARGGWMVRSVVNAMNI